MAPAESPGVPFIIENPAGVAAIGMSVIAFGIMCIVGLMVWYQVVTGEGLRQSRYEQRKAEEEAVEAQKADTARSGGGTARSGRGTARSGGSAAQGGQFVAS